MVSKQQEKGKNIVTQEPVKTSTTYFPPFEITPFLLLNLFFFFRCNLFLILYYNFFVLLYSPFNSGFVIASHFKLLALDVQVSRKYYKQKRNAFAKKKHCISLNKSRFLPFL